jgi:hypothetical protein
MINVRNLLTFIALAFIDAGAVLGLAPVSIDEISCGSAFLDRRQRSVSGFQAPGRTLWSVAFV